LLSSEALSIAMQQITNDNEHQNYIQIYVWHFESTSMQKKKALCDTMYTLTLKEGLVPERALNLYTLSKRYNTMNTSHIDSCKP
jgi:hypothetical protein